MRQAIGPDVTLAIDGNGKWDLPTCQRFCRAAQDFDVFWFEEPLWHDDVKGHAQLARATSIPVAPHAGDMSQVHVHLSYAHPACEVLEYIPWIKDCFIEPADVVDGYFKLPQLPGAGTTPSASAWEKYRQASH